MAIYGIGSQGTAQRLIIRKHSSAGKFMEDSSVYPKPSFESPNGEDELRFRPGRIYLVGMPGSGKSSSGKLLARLLGYAFEDLDSAIEQTSGMSVNEIFTHKGEDYFRELETKCLELFHTRSTLVLATGGGAVMNNMDRMLQHGWVLWLDIPVHELIRRVSMGAERRPLFRNLSKDKLEMKLWELYRQRLSLYALAHRRVGDEQALLDWGQRILFLPSAESIR